MRNILKYLQAVLPVFLLLLGTQSVVGATVTVCKTCAYTSVKQAVLQANPGDTVLVKSGVYQESDILIDKSLRLIGEGNPVIDGNFTGQLISVKGDDVTIQGFTLKNVATSYSKDDAAIRVFQRSNIQILNNTILKTYFGIYMRDCDGVVIKGNKIVGDNKDKMESSLGNAIHLYYSENVEITDNNVQGHRDGIYLEVVKNSQVHRNISHQNLRYGMHFMFSDGNTYTYNIFRNNGAGVAVMYTNNVRMAHNTFEQNWGAASYGLLLKDISQSVIHNNTFRRNTTAIHMESSSRLHIKNNDFERNGWAIKLMTTCIEDTFRLNNFTGNSFDVSTNGTIQENFFEHNYWDKYTGYDLDKDQKGDVPYRPVSLFSMLVERVPPAIMFMRSFMVNLLDSLEKVLPSITPEQLVDDQPLMKKIDHDNDKQFVQVLRKTSGAPQREPKV